ncbi:MAG: FAD-dependent oxidoreductase, partial [Actinobacteria bacterium]|nr:FAD-dependent oxidoreductase [Actinomycetota bacterium]
MISHGGDRVLHARVDDVPWDREADVVVAGSGGAGWAAALGAASAGASALVLEKAERIGGTTAQAGGGTTYRASTWLWICDHPWLGAPDPRPEALRYMARLAFPTLYAPNAPQLGLPPERYRLLETFFDRGKEVVSALSEIGALDFAPLEHINDYYADFPENAVGRGRALYLRMPDGREGTGGDIVDSMAACAGRLGVEVRTGARVRGLVLDADTGAVAGVAAGGMAADAMLIRARGGVVFATGGFAHDRDLVREHLRGPVLGSAASTANQGDFVRIASAAGARLGAMNEAWLTPVVLDQLPAPASGVFRLPGDSMILVNRYGERVVNEKTTYNEMTRAFFAWDPARAEYPNLPLVMVYDGSVSERCRDLPEDAPVAEGGGNPLPRVPGGEAHEVTGGTWEELAAAIDAHLRRNGRWLPGVRLDGRFVERLRASVGRFDRMAAVG